MSGINYVGGLIRTFDYCKIAGTKKYEGAMVITRNRIKGKSFWITEAALWKYLEPSAYKGDEQAFKADAEDFFKMMGEIRQEQVRLTWKLWTPGYDIETRRAEIQHSLDICEDAINLARLNGYYLSVSYNLLKCMDMLEIIPCTEPQRAAAQLLLWIQSKLPDLKDLPPFEEPKEFVEGSVKVKMGEAVFETDIKVAESELIERDNNLVS